MNQNLADHFTYYSAETIALVAGAKTIDLTALPGLPANIDRTGLKVQVFQIKGRSGNEMENGAPTISGEAANPYDMFGGAAVVDRGPGGLVVDLIYPAGCTNGALTISGEAANPYDMFGGADLIYPAGCTNGALTISGGAVNPYHMFGGADFVYPAGCTKALQFEFDGKLADIAAGAKNIDLAGTGDELFDIGFILAKSPYRGA